MIRKAEPRDLPEIVELWEQMAEYENKCGSDLYDPDDHKRLNSYYQACAQLMGNDQGIILVSEDDAGKIYGFLAATIYRMFGFAKREIQVKVMAINFSADTSPLVKAINLRKGYKLLRQWGKQFGATGVEGNIFHNNNTAREMNRKFGFRATYIKYERGW
jgi:hypothetical protein